MKTFSFVLGVVLLLIPTFSFAEKARVIEWNDLIPKQLRADDQLSHLTEEELDRVEWVIYLRRNLPEKITERDQVFYDEMIESIGEWRKKGIDVDKIVAERQVRENSLNSELDGKRIRLAGYLLPLNLSNKVIKEFLLVPYIGACTHVPPPPRNQIIYATTGKAITFVASEIFEPVWATGRLIMKPMSKELYLGDGTGNINIGYALAVDKIEPYKEQ